MEIVVRRVPHWNPNDELYHHGIKGQRWGVRRYQNPDGSLTAAGKERYSKEFEKAISKKSKGTVQTANANYVYPDSVQAVEKTKLGKDIYNNKDVVTARNIMLSTKSTYQDAIQDYKTNRKKWIKEAIPDYYKTMYPEWKNRTNEDLVHEYLDFWVHEDGDQGVSLAYYLNKTGNRSKVNAYEQASYNYGNIITKKVIDKYGGEPLTIKDRYGYKSSIEKVVKNAIEDYDGTFELETPYFYMDNKSGSKKIY